MVGVGLLVASRLVSLPIEVARAMSGVVGVALVMRDASIVQFHLPQVRRQVPRSVFGKNPYSAAVSTGLRLGMGVFTKVPSSSPYFLAVAVVLLVDSTSVPLMAGLGFGIGRGLMPVARYLSQSDSRWDDEFRRREARLVPITTFGIVVGIMALAVNPHPL